MKTCEQCKVNYPDAVKFCPVDGSALPMPPGFTEAEAAEPEDPLIGQTVDGRYIVETRLGQGGMGYVYAARHAIIDKRVAIKVLRAEHAQHDNSAAQRFLVEAKAASKIGHQNIVDITDFGVLADGKTYFVMEFLDGPTLGKLLHQGGPLPPLRAIAVAVQIARGLQAAHDKGIIHRDLKPENIFILERDGQKDFVKIVDFGIAKDVAHKKKLTQAGMVLGTPEYMSPEQATGQPTDHRVDMYALGCIVYEMLTGTVPFKADTPTKTLTQHVFDKVQPPSERRPDLKIPPNLEAVVMRSLQKKPTDRFESLKEMIGALERCERELRPRSPSSQVLKPVSQPLGTLDAIEAVAGPRRKMLTLVAAGGAAVVALVLVVALAKRSGPPKEAAAPPAAPAATAAPTAAPATPPPAAPTAPKQVELVLRTRPPGADVLEAGRPVGVSPVTIRRDRSELAVIYTFRRSGYKDETRSITASGDKEIEVVLEPRAGTRVAQTGGRHAHTAAGAPSTSKGRDAPQPKARVTDLRNPFD